MRHTIQLKKDRKYILKSSLGVRELTGDCFIDLVPEEDATLIDVTDYKKDTTVLGSSVKYNLLDAYNKIESAISNVEKIQQSLLEHEQLTDKVFIEKYYSQLRNQSDYLKYLMDNLHRYKLV